MPRTRSCPERRRRRVIAAMGVAVLALATLLAPAAAGATARVLVFSRTTAFRHASIPTALVAMEEIALQRGWSLTASEDATRFTPGVLAGFDVVVFLLTSGDVLDPGQQAALEAFIRSGRGYAGVHAASDTEYDWPWYGELVGAYFLTHPAIQPATVRVSDRDHPSTTSLPVQWVRDDEWYDFRSNPRQRVHVLATLDERTYSGGGMGWDHPIAWCHDHDGGRAWYTAGGHTGASYQEPLFRQHLALGIEWAAGLLPGDCSVPALREPSGYGSPWPLRLVKAPAGAISVVVEDVSGSTGYVVYEQALGTWYGTPGRTCHGAWADRGDTVALAHAPSPGSRWLVVAAADGRGESSCGQDALLRELNRLPGWPPTGPCP